MGLVWFEQSMRNFGIEGIVEKEYGSKANREIAANDLKIGVAAWLDIHNGRMNSENYHKELK